MVLESVVAQYLNKYLFNYVENLDGNQLKISIWGGDIVLKDLRISDNALDDLDLPVQLVFGHIGKFVLKIPWKSIYSQRVVVHIEDLFLLVSPKQSVPYDEEKEQMDELKYKQAILKAFDEAYKKELENGEKADPTYVEKLVARVINNIQVKIANVHIRYEDNSSPEQPYAFGITLHEFEIFTTDENWQECFVDGVIRHVYKLANLDCLSVYMNCSIESYKARSSGEILELFRNNIATKSSMPMGYSFVLGPISSLAKLLLNSDPNQDDEPFTIPKVDLSLEMEKLNISFSSNQFQLTMRLLDDMNQFKLGAPYRKYRPFELPYKGNAKIWWNFVITCVLNEKVRKKNRTRTWEYIKEHRELCRTYAEAYKECCLTKKPTATLEETCNLAEQKLDLFNLKLIRKQTQIEVERLRNEVESKKENKSGGWFGGWFGSSRSSDQKEDSDLASSIKAAMTSEEKQKLHEAMGYEDNVAPLQLPEHFEAVQFKFTLQTFEIDLYDDDSEKFGTETLMLLKLNTTTCTVTQRPAASAISLCVGMKDLNLSGYARNNVIPPTIIKSKISQQSNFLDIFFETNPLDKHCDQRVKVMAHPLQIVYDAETVLKLMKVFVPKQKVNLSELEGAATLKISDFKERSATGMQYMIESHVIVEVDVCLMPNILILPEGGLYEPSKRSMVVIGLGELSIKSAPRKDTSKDVEKMFNIGKDQDEILQIIMGKAYDCYKVSIENIQVMTVRPNENWELVMRNMIRSDMHLLHPTSVLIDAKLCVLDDDPRLPKTKVEILLPSIKLNLAEDRVFEALKVGLSIPLPESNAPATPVKSNLVKTSSNLSVMLSVPQFLNQDQRRKVLAASPTTSEVVQYTSLDLRFALEEFSITIIRSSFVEPQSPVSDESSPEFETPSQESRKSSLTDADFVDTHSSVGIIPDSNKLLAFQVLQLEVSVTQRTFEMVAQAKLGAIGLISYDESNQKTENGIVVIETPGYTQHGKSLLNVKFTTVDKTTPDFKTKYKSTEQLVQINFATLNLILHQENLLHLMEIADKLQRKLQKIQTSMTKKPQEPPKPKDRTASTFGDEGFIRRLRQISEENEFANLNPIKTNVSGRKLRKRIEHKIVQSIKMKIEANLEQVGLELTCKKRSIASLKINHVNAGVVLKTAYTEIQIGLKNILIIDMNPLNIHTNFLSIVGNNALKCDIVIYDLEETKNYNSDNMKIYVDIGCMKIVFINWFVTSVLSFMNNFQAAQKAIADAGAAAADAAKQNAVAAYEDATRIRLNVKLKAPLIIVPIDAKSLEAVVLDLGLLNMSNVITEINTSNETRGAAVIDEIKLVLRDMRLARIKILEDNLNQRHTEDLTSDAEMDVVDSYFGFNTKLNILDPTSFTLVVKRNLSFSWYKNLPEIDISGRLKCIELNLFKEDYGLLMLILNRNMQEGSDEFPRIIAPAPPPPPPRTSAKNVFQSPIKSTVDPATRALSKMKNKVRIKKKEEEKISEQFKFNFQFDGVVINLMAGVDEGLARFGLYVLSLRGTKLLDETLTTNILLCNIELEDTRPSNTSQIKTYLCSRGGVDKELRNSLTAPKYATSISQKVDKECLSMLDVTAVIKQNDTVAKVRISSFDLILCVDFMLKLAHFCKIPEKEENADIQVKSEKSIMVQPEPPPPQPGQLRSIASAAIVARQLSQSEENNVSKMNLTLIIEEPEIILVETLNDMNTSAIIFNMGIDLSYRAIGQKQIIMGKIDNLKMYMCCFTPEKRASTQHYILFPCAVNLHGSTPENDGLNLSLSTSDIIINISPATLELINKAVNSITSHETDQSMTLTKDRSCELWTAKRFKEQEFWFLRPEQADDAFDVLESEESTQSVDNFKTECCVIEVPSFIVVLEAGIGYYTTPLISLDTSISAIANDWSSSLRFNGNLTVSMNYYNQSLATWEPVIEQNERIAKDGGHSYVPWQLNFNLSIEKTVSEFDEGKEESKTSILIHSDENLEVTVSKTFLDLIGQLSEAFGQAMDPDGLSKPQIQSPYEIQNDTGFDLHLNFTSGAFTLHDSHMPNAHGKGTSIVFEFEEGSNILPDTIKCCTISPGGKAYLRTKAIESESSNYENYTLHATIGNIKKQLLLPVSKADKRYFPLYRDINQDPWGIVSEVNSQFGTTHINIHSVVYIQNHFTTPIFVYRKKDNKYGELLHVGVVEPGSVYHVPLHAIYSEGKCLHFGISDFHTSVQGIKWDDSPTDTAYTRLLQCDPIETFEPFFINVNREKTEIYHEHTNKYKLMSAYYTLHLRPPVYLRNTLPIKITVSVAGCSVRQEVRSTQSQMSQTQESLSSSIDGDSKHSLKNADSYVKEELLHYGEKDVQAGSVLHLPTVKLAGRSKVTRSFLVVRMIQYLERDWSCTTEISGNHSGVVNWRFSSYDSDAKMSMDLCVKFEDHHGSLFITLFSPFWLINKTGKMLSYKTDSENVEVLYHPPEYSGPILFSVRDKHLFDKKTCTIRVENGEWSNKIPLDVAGSTGSVGCKISDQIFQIGVHNHLTQNSLTKHITFIPFYTISNKCGAAIEVQEHCRPADPWHKVESNCCLPLWPKNDSDNMLVAKVFGERTVPFNYSDPSCNLLQLKTNECCGINVDVQVTEGGVYITFTEYYPGDAPGLLINHTHHPIFYYEKGVNSEMVLQPYQKVLFTWHNPAGEKMLVFGKNSVKNDLRRDGYGNISIDGETDTYWVSFLDGLQRVLLFTQCEDIAIKSETSNALQSITQSIEVKIHGIGLSLINNETGVDILYLGITSTGVIWETRKHEKKRFKLFSLHDTELLEAAYQQYLLDKALSKNIGKCFMLEGKYQVDFEHGTMLKDNTAREIRRQFQPGVWIELNTSPFQSQMHAKINHIQLDNQLTDCIFPVVLAPIPPPKTLAKTVQFKPFVEVSIVERVVPHSTVKQYKYARVLMQEFHFKVDLVFLMAIAELFAANVDEEREAKLFEEDVSSIKKPLSDLVAIHSQLQQKNFYDNLHLGPMKVHVSFSMAGVDTSVLPGVLSDLMHGVGVTLTDVNDVVLRLAFFEREFKFYSQDQLKSEIVSHYTGQALKQIYVLVLGLDVLGNPYGLVVGLKKGVEDLFYEPFQGAIQGPGEFAEGLVLGVKSLFGHTVGGAAGAVSKITGAMGQGLAVLTFDEDYQKKRRQALNAKPKTFHEGMARSGKGLVMGFVDGVTGCVKKPIAGAKEQGVEGFFKGLGKGTIGLVTRPTAGIVDFAHGTFDSVKRATELHEETKRLRPARFIYEDKILRSYRLDKAKGNQLLKEIEKGKYASTDSFIHCEEIIAKQEFVIVSNHRILYVSRNDMFGSWNVQWTYLWTEIDRIKATDYGIEVILKKEGKKVLGLFSSGEPQQKMIILSVKKRREKLFEAIDSYLRIV